MLFLLMFCWCWELYRKENVCIRQLRCELKILKDSLMRADILDILAKLGLQGKNVDI